MGHTKEPFGHDDHSGAGAINRDLFSGGCFAAEAMWPDKEVNARRIVACVNACVGVGTEYLEDNGPIIELVREHNTVLKQRDELLAALEKFMDSHEGCADVDGFTAQIVSMDDYHEAQEAIERAKGGALKTDRKGF